MADPVPPAGWRIDPQQTQQLGFPVAVDGKGGRMRLKAPQVDPGGLEVLGGGYKRNPVGKMYREGPKGGFTQVGGPNDTQIGEAMKTASGLNSALAAIDRIDRQLGKTRDVGPLGVLTNNTDLAVLKQSTRDLMLRMKEQPYNLGVLNGPDLDIMDQIISNPDTLDSAVFRAKLKPLLQNLSSIMGDQYRMQSDQFGAFGGREEALPPLYRSPRSKFTPEEFGREGRVSPAALQRPAGRQPTTPNVPERARAAYDARVKAGKVDTSKPRGDGANPFLAVDMATANRLPKGSYVILPDGSYGVVE